ncbi:Hypothetical protein CINCED_3A012415 [Cinara cedri]|nr:Hypothetical protein CINCED_3A012415 [Cinara cedri]
MQKCSIKLCLPSYRICSNHFLPEDILCHGLLKKNAIPITNQMFASSVPTSQLIDDLDLTGHEIECVNRFITSSQPEIPSSLTEKVDEHSVSPRFQTAHIFNSQITSTFVGKSLIKTPNVSTKRNSSVSSSLLKRQKVLNPSSIGDWEVDHVSSPGKN